MYKSSQFQWTSALEPDQELYLWTLLGGPAPIPSPVIGSCSSLTLSSNQQPDADHQYQQFFQASLSTEANTSLMESIYATAM